MLDEMGRPHPQPKDGVVSSIKIARLNAFEGSRRIALVAKVLWLACVVVVASMARPYVSLRFATLGPQAAFVRGLDQCELSIDAIEFVTRDFDGESVSAQLCFKAQQSDAGDRLVPYRTDEKGRWWGNKPYTPEVAAYTEARAQRFTLTEADGHSAREEWRRQSSVNYRNAAMAAVGGWIALSLLQALIGWIVRGFMGIPWGHDSRPQSPSA